MHPAPLFVAVQSASRRPRTYPGSPRRARRAAIAATIAVLAAGGLIADSHASTPDSVAALNPHAISIGTSGTIVAPGHFGWQRHCPVTAQR